MAESQRSVANRALAQARRMNAPAILQKALIEAGLVESNLQHQKYERVGSGDRDSVGFLQQRPSAGWGPAGQSIEQDTAQFIRAGQKVLSSGFKGSSGQLAQAIQRSAFPARYMQRAGEAEQFLRGAASSGGSTPGAGRGSGVSSGGSTRTVTTTTPGVDNRAARAALIQSFLSDTNSDPVDFAMQANALKDIAPTSTTKTVRIPGAAASAQQSTTGAAASSMLPKGKSKLLELIHNTGPGRPGFAVKNGQKVNGPQFYSGVWAGHADHVHVAAGPKTIVQLGKLAQRMGLKVGENPHFGGVDPVHVPGSYHYKGEAIDVSGDPNLMNAYARRVERLYGIGGGR